MFRYNLKLFVRAKHIFLPFLLALFLSGAFMVVGLHTIRADMYIGYLNSSQSLGLLGFIFFAFLAYEYISSVKRADMDEALDIIPNGTVRFQVVQLLLLAIPIILFSIVVLVFNLYVYHIAQMNVSAYAIHILKCTVLNIFLVAAIAAVFGAVLAQRTKRVWAYLVLLFSAFVISPVFDTIASVLAATGVNIYPVLDGVRILAPNLNWMTDAIYGLSIEACRWNIAVFWLAGLAAVFLFGTTKNKRSISLIASIFLTLVAAVNLGLYLQSGQDSIIRKDGRQNGVLLGEERYWRAHEILEKEADFRVVEYDMELTADRNLSATVEMMVDASQDNEVYSFTLYRGYDISSITDALGQELDFIRRGDYLDIYHSLAQSTEKIIIAYSGNGNKYYSNSQGVALPGYFPFYPMPGHLALWNNEQGNVQINHDFTEKRFTVKIVSPLNITSNLGMQGGNCFSGTATTVSLYGGFVETDISGGLTCCHSSLDGVNPDLSGLEERWQDIKALIGEEREITFLGKTLFVQPSTITAAAGSDRERFVFLDDHIWAAYSDSDIMCAFLVGSLLPYSVNSENLTEAFLSYLEKPQHDYQVVDIPTYNELDLLKRDMLQIERNNLIPQYFEARERFKDLFCYAIEKRGAGDVLKATYQYLLNDADTLHEVDFLYELLEGSEDD